jgi:hypothetical protein
MASSDRRTFVLTVAALAAASSANAVASEGPKVAAVIEIVRFKLAPGMTPQAFLALDQAVAREHVAKQSGFVRRESASTPDGEWLVIVHWASAADADASMASFASAPAATFFMKGLDVSTMTMQRFSSH